MTVASTQTFSISFHQVSYDDLLSDAAFYNSFTTSYTESVAGGAGVASSQVAITSLSPGSVVVATSVSYSNADIAAGAAPDALEALLTADGGLTALFADSPLLASYSSDATASAFNTSAAATPTATSTPPTAPSVASPTGVPTLSPCGRSPRPCDPLVTCDPAPGGGYTCGECPAGMLGSGHQRCLPRLSCEQDNGGCDLFTDCVQEAGGQQACTACPTGYAGTGATGCVDENGCSGAEGGTRCHSACLDVPAPGTGYTCAPCPADMVGDGVTCLPNLCYTQNGGCDVAVTCKMDPVTGIRECGSCPIGTEPVPNTASSSLSWRCEETDGCAAAPCWSDGVFRQTCDDVPAPGTGHTCGPCPAGFLENLSGTGCDDVDECGLLANGGCWESEADSSVRTKCENQPGTFSCSACPPRYIGTGEAGCRERVMCDTSNGNCDPLASCTDNLATGYAECGPCPAGYSGTGDTVCVDADGCALEPCFPGVECADVAAPGEGRTCGSCPEGYRGDGVWCEACSVLLRLDPEMGTVVDGEMKRSVNNQLAGVFGGLSSPDCVLTQVGPITLKRHDMNQFCHHK
ncbi:hypothetical protein CYMTET_35938 [Cymbomonas tetramitiformis]|uniref:EGF-like domain-containing protein n=1 Tax=Cymbomonas tetramitiformis TaxID=36881 RepID=A0AAE0F897_9CHLO|nr:hypothetical protein CYMTET_35938 [Cymbomonas tetramitiformis]